MLHTMQYADGHQTTSNQILKKKCEMILFPLILNSDVLLLSSRLSQAFQLTCNYTAAWWGRC